MCEARWGGGGGGGSRPSSLGSPESLSVANTLATTKYLHGASSSLIKINLTLPWCVCVCVFVFVKIGVSRLLVKVEGLACILENASADQGLTGRNVT